MNFTSLVPGFWAHPCRQWSGSLVWRAILVCGSVREASAALFGDSAARPPGVAPGVRAEGRSECRRSTGLVETRMTPSSMAPSPLCPLACPALRDSTLLVGAGLGSATRSPPLQNVPTVALTPQLPLPNPPWALLGTPCWPCRRCTSRTKAGLRRPCLFPHLGANRPPPARLAHTASAP